MKRRTIAGRLAVRASLCTAIALLIGLMALMSRIADRRDEIAAGYAAILLVCVFASALVPVVNLYRLYRIEREWSASGRMDEESASVFLGSALSSLAGLVAPAFALGFVWNIFLGGAG